MDKRQIIEKRWRTINIIFVVMVICTLLFFILREIWLGYTAISLMEERIKENEVLALQIEVQNRKDEVQTVQESQYDEFKEEIKTKVFELDFFASQAVSNMEGNPTLEEKQEVYIDVIYEYDLSQDDYIMFIIDKDGYTYLSGVTKFLEGTDISGLQDQITGEYFILDMIEATNNEEDSGFHTYHYPKEIDGEHLKKTSFIYYNEEVDMIMGTGLYFDDYEQRSLEEFISRIEDYYSEEEDFIYIFDEEGQIIANENELFTQEIFLGLKTVEGNSLFTEVTDTLEEAESVIADFTMELDGRIQTRTAYIEKIENWNLYIGKSYEVVTTLEYEAFVNQTLRSAIITISILAGMLALFSYYIKNMMTKNFTLVEEIFTESEAVIKRISFIDSLTGVYNRKYLNLMKASINQTNNSYVLYLGDLNGLKIANDAFGHHEGDELILKAVMLLQEVFPHDEIVRIGGDEFLVFSKNAEAKYIKDKINQFNQSITNYKTDNLTLSIALGYVVCEADSDFDQNVMIAERDMYRKKTYETTYKKREIIDNILTMLYRDYIGEEEHSKNVMKYSVMIGNELNLEVHEIKKLRLSSLMHDIGKVSIDKKIINEKQSLTEKEWEKVKEHSQKGYKILSQYPELSEYADVVLYHHENYDGSGYPKGISKNDIPLLSRIIRVADSFDAMTNDRCYKKKISIEEAMNELNQNKEKLYDPLIVESFVKAFFTLNLEEKE